LYNLRPGVSPGDTHKGGQQGLSQNDWPSLCGNEYCFLSQKKVFSKSEKSIFQVRKKYFPSQKTLFSALENDIF